MRKEQLKKLIYDEIRDIKKMKPEDGENEVTLEVKKMHFIAEAKSILIRIMEAFDKEKERAGRQQDGNYRYLSVRRPVGPGTYPKDKNNPIVYFTNFEKRVDMDTDDGLMPAWGYVDFKIPISSKQLAEYELYPAKTTFSQQKTRLIDGVTECCGYDFGGEQNVSYCPICGREIEKISFLQEEIISLGNENTIFLLQYRSVTDRAGNYFDGEDPYRLTEYTFSSIGPKGDIRLEKKISRYGNRYEWSKEADDERRQFIEEFKEKHKGQDVIIVNVPNEVVDIDDICYEVLSILKTARKKGKYENSTAL